MLNRCRVRVSWTVVAVLILTTACRVESPTGDTGKAARDRGRTAGQHVWTTPDGNSIPYEIGGNLDADVTVVMVHCWMCNRSFWDAQLPALAESYRTITLDLPGHGEATAAREVWTIADFGEDLAGLIKELKVTDVILVGHSMGGPVSLRASALLPEIVLGIVAVDTLHDADFKFDGEHFDGFMRAFEADFAGTCERFIEQMIPEDGVEELASWIRETGCDEGRSRVGIALMRNFGVIDLPTWFREAGVPIRAINASTPNPTRIETNRKYADFDAVLMDGVGHYPHMTRPDRFNELLLKTIAEIVATRSASPDIS